MRSQAKTHGLEMASVKAKVFEKTGHFGCIQTGGFRGTVQNTGCVSGPVSITYHPNVRGRDFYIFGDRHASTEGSCHSVMAESQCSSMIDVVDLLEVIFRETEKDRKIDFYLEIPFQEKKIKGQDPGIELRPDEILHRIWTRFKTCFRPDKKQCDYPNVRFHYADIRDLLTNPDQLDKGHGKSVGPKRDFFGKYNENLHKIKTALKNADDKKIRFVLRDGSRYLKFLESADEYKALVRDYISIPHLEWYNQYVEKAFESTGVPKKLKFIPLEAMAQPGENRIKKQIDSLPSWVRKPLIQFFEDRLTILADVYGDIPDALAEAWKKAWATGDSSDLRTVLTVKWMTLLETGALMMDMYTIARMFKPSLADSKEVWLYAGDAHSRRLRGFLRDYLGFEDYWESYPIALRCQDIHTLQSFEESVPESSALGLLAHGIDTPQYTDRMGREAQAKDNDDDDDDDDDLYAF